MKIAPILRAFARDPRFVARLVHTGQHYDASLSRVFFDELGIPNLQREGVPAERASFVAGS